MWDVFGSKRRKAKRIAAAKVRLSSFSDKSLISLSKYLASRPCPFFRDNELAATLYAIAELLRERGERDE